MKALIVVDMLNDFILKDGALYSGERAEEIVDFIKDRINEFRANNQEVIFLCDNHEIDDKEFEMFPPHCIAGEYGSAIVDDEAHIFALKEAKNTLGCNII